MLQHSSSTAKAGSIIGESLHVDVVPLRHTIQLCLGRVMPRPDDNAIDLILEFSLPATPKLALLGSLKLNTHGRTLQSYGVGTGAVPQNVMVFDESFLVSVSSEDPTHILAWSLSLKGCPCHRVYTGAESAITSVGINADADVIACGCVDGSIHVWNLSSGEAICTCGYHEWDDHWTHSTNVTTVGCGSIYDESGTDIISGDDIGILCTWWQGQTGGHVKLCVDVNRALDCSSCRISCTSYQLGLVVCGLQDGIALGYHTDSSQCVFKLEIPLPSAMLAIGLVQTQSDDPWEANLVLGCCADGTILCWNITAALVDLSFAFDGQSCQPQVLPPKFLAHAFSGVKGAGVKDAVATFVKRQVVWAAPGNKPETPHLRWSDINENEQLSVVSRCLRQTTMTG